MKLVYILANHRSGSTLTDFSLNALEGVVSGGELVRFSMDESERRHSFGNRCQCKQSLDSCQYWCGLKSGIFGNLSVSPDHDWSSLKLYPRAGSLAYRSRFLSYLFNRLALLSPLAPPDSLTSYGDNSWRFFDAFANQQDAEFVVDSSKTLVRFLNLYRARPKDTFVIWLTRDGRGVLNSMTKDLDLSEASVEKQIRKDATLICTEQRRMQSVFNRIPDANKMHCKYEDLCREPDRFLDQIAFALGTRNKGFDTLKYRDYHGVPGSEHMRIDSGLVVDDGWRSRLTPQALEIYKSCGGSIFERLGYETGAVNND